MYKINEGLYINEGVSLINRQIHGNAKEGVGIVMGMLKKRGIR